MSVLATITVLNMKVPNVIAKASSVTHGEVLKRLGAKVVYPERDMAIRLGKGLLYNNFLDSVTLQGNVEVRRIEVTGDLIGTSVVESNIRRKYGINIIAIERGPPHPGGFPRGLPLPGGGRGCAWWGTPAASSGSRTTCSDTCGPAPHRGPAFSRPFPPGFTICSPSGGGDVLQ